MISETEQFETQVERFHKQMVGLIKRYQFRDRNQINCCGVSVSQCYILEALYAAGPMTMKQLSANMQLSVSTVTRVVEPLVRKGYVERTEGREDRRVRLISLSEKGKKFFCETWQNIFQSERIILENFPEENREMLIEFLTKLNKAVENWQSCCTQ